MRNCTLVQLGATGGYVLPTAEPLSAQVLSEPGSLLTGDLGLVVVRSLLETGTGYVMASWQERPTPIDVAIDHARDAVLVRHGIKTRRLQSATALRASLSAVQTPNPQHGGASRVAVVLGGRRGMLPTLTELAALEVAGGVVVLCFDEDVAQMSNALVVDPVPTVRGLHDAMHDAYEASVRARRPAIVLIRERLLGARGTIRCRSLTRADEAAARDAMFPTVDLPEAVIGSHLARIDASASSDSHVLVVVGPAALSAARAVETLRARTTDAAVARQLDELAIVSTTVIGVAPSDLAESMMSHGRRVLMLVPRGTVARYANAVAGRSLDADVRVEAIPVRGDAIIDVLSTWVAADLSPQDSEREPAIVHTSTATSHRLAGRAPRRNAVLHRGVTPTLAAGLTLAQGAIGVPRRVDSAHQTYITDAGVALTIASTSDVAAQGAGIIAPNVGAGVIVLGAGADYTSFAGMIGATVELVDATSPRVIGAAIARACSAPRAQSHVIALAPVARASADTGIGLDLELQGTERLALSSIPTAATALVRPESELLVGPARVVLDTPEAAAAIGPVRELTSATWQLLDRRANGRAAQSQWMLRRRMVRTAGGVDL